jgi:hypothetical protein
MKEPRQRKPVSLAGASGFLLSSQSQSWPRAALPSKGLVLIRCTVPGPTPKRLAMPRTPSPVCFRALRASRIRSSTSRAIGGLPSWR